MVEGISKPLVSVIVPVYNCEAFVGETIQSVIDQSFTDWELIIIDDCSTDKSMEVIQNSIANIKQAVTLLSNESNLGAARSRNRAIELASGRYLAYLDSDDVWMPEKLATQIEYMSSHNAAMCFTSYETIEENGMHRNYVHVPKLMQYKDFLKNTITCCHTIAIDLSQIKKKLLINSDARDYDYPEDLAIWLRILKTGINAHGIDCVLAKNRKRNSSRSADKIQAVRRTWNQYIYGEKLSVPYAAYCLFWQLFHAVLKRL